MTIGNFTVICGVSIIFLETVLLILAGLSFGRNRAVQKALLQKIGYTFSVTQKLRSIISEKSRNSVLSITNALGELELIEEEIKDNLDTDVNAHSEKEIAQIVDAIDKTLCKCLENLQFEDYTNQIREHIQILLHSVIPNIPTDQVSQKVQTQINEQCRQIFSIDEEFDVLRQIAEDNTK